MTSQAAKIRSHMILIAEDSHHDRAILQQAFSELQAAVNLIFVDNGEELVDYLRSEASPAQSRPGFPSLVMMDLNMPRMNGIEALKIVRADEKLCTLPVIVLSTSDNPRLVAQAYADGTNAFMTKPSRFDDLVSLLEKFAAFWLEGAELPPSPETSL